MNLNVSSRCRYQPQRSDTGKLGVAQGIEDIVPVAFSEALFVFGAMEDIRNDKYLARS